MTRTLFGALKSWLVACGLLAAGMQAATAQKTYTFAVVPGAPPVTMSKVWTPVIEQLKKDTGIELRLKLFDRMAEFERHIWTGESDFIFASPIQTVMAHQSQKYIPLVRDGKLVDISLFVRQDSPIQSIDDLMGKKISFVGNKNVCSVYIQHELMNYGKKLDFDKEYAGSSRNVILNVLFGKVDAGAVFSPEFARESEENRQQLRAVVTTTKFAPHPISAHPRVPQAVREAVRKALLKLATTPAGEEMLKPLRLDDLVQADYDKDYRDLEKIDVKGMTNWGE